MKGSIARGECRQTLAEVDKQAIKSMCDDPAGSICYFLPIYKNGAVEITWEIVHHEADHYYLERRKSSADEFAKIPGTQFFPDRTRNPGTYVYVDAEGTVGSIYRLVEVDIHGNTFVHDIEQAMMLFEYKQSATPDFDPDELYRELEKWAAMSTVNREVAVRTQYVTEDWVAIGPVEYIDSPGILALAYWHGQYGLTTGITILQHIEDYWEGDLKSYLNYLYEHGTKYVMLVGDANDHELWDDPAVWAVNGWDSHKPDLVSQPAYDIIPADYFLDQDPRETNMSYFTPYYASDLPKSDVNGDGYPELVIGRIPAHSVDDVLAYGSKAVKYLQSSGGSWTDDISILINKWNVWGNDGSLAETFGMNLLNYLPPGYTKHLLRNDCPECCDCWSYAVRESRACAEFNQGRALIVSIGSGAHYYDMNFWFEVAGGFDITKLNNNNIFPFLLGISCDLGAFEKTESPQWGRPICERLIFDDDRGIIGMFAPTRGSWQTGNYLIGKLVLENLYTYGAPSLGHACALAQRDLITQYPRYSDLAVSYVFLGDPALQLFGSAITSSPPPLCNITVNYADNDFLFACPAGDAQQLEADLAFVFNFGHPYDISKEDIRLQYSQDEESFIIFNDGAINAQADAVAPDYTTTLSHAYFGGCGCDTISIVIEDRPVGCALLKVKTCDLNKSGKVDLGDLSIFGDSYCKVASDSGFNSCCDFNGDERCNLIDLSYLGIHYLDEHPWYQHSAPVLVQSNVTATLNVERIRKPNGKTRLLVTIDLDNAAEVTSICLGLKSPNNDIIYTGWKNNPEFRKTVLATPVNNHDRELVFIYAYGGRESDNNRITMGSVEYCMGGPSEGPLSAEEFKLVIGDVMDAKGNIKTIHGIEPKQFSSETTAYRNHLYANFPNPFNPETIITFSIAQDMNVNLSIYNVSGQLIRCLVNEYRRKNTYSEVWDGKDGHGNLTASGVYFCTLKTDSHTRSKKLVLIR